MQARPERSAHRGNALPEGVGGEVRPGPEGRWGREQGQREGELGRAGPELARGGGTWSSAASLAPWRRPRGASGGSGSLDGSEAGKEKAELGSLHSEVARGVSSAKYGDADGCGQ